MAGLLPGDTVPVAFTCTTPLIVPEPPNVPLALTITSVAAPPFAMEPFTINVPPLTVVTPV